MKRLADRFIDVFADQKGNTLSGKRQEGMVIGEVVTGAAVVQTGITPFFTPYIQAVEPLSAMVSRDDVEIDSYADYRSFSYGCGDQDTEGALTLNLEDQHGSRIYRIGSDEAETVTVSVWARNPQGNYLDNSIGEYGKHAPVDEETSVIVKDIVGKIIDAASDQTAVSI